MPWNPCLSSVKEICFCPVTITIIALVRANGYVNFLDVCKAVVDTDKTRMLLLVFSARNLNQHFGELCRQNCCFCLVFSEWASNYYSVSDAALPCSIRAGWAKAYRTANSAKGRFLSRSSAPSMWMARELHLCSTRLLESWQFTSGLQDLWPTSFPFQSWRKVVLLVMYSENGNESPLCEVAWALTQYLVKQLFQSIPWRALEVSSKRNDQVNLES